MTYLHRPIVERIVDKGGRVHRVLRGPPAQLPLLVGNHEYIGV